ncbi:MAG: glycogen/starch synthase, partial [Clostridia bacterium]|nr:glycogen/starch synthase [Clostridia bacterium]
MRILYVTSEASPYAASGGLGDVMGSLPGAVKALLGEESEVAVILPLYAQIAKEHRAQMEKVMEFRFSYVWRQAYAGIYKLTNEEGVDYYFVDNEQYFSRP